MSAEPGWCSVCGLPVPAGEGICRWPFGGRAGDGQYDDEVVPWASHSLAFMTELVELQHWRCPWCGITCLTLRAAPRSITSSPGFTADRTAAGICSFCTRSATRPRAKRSQPRRWSWPMLTAWRSAWTSGNTALESGAGRPRMPCGQLASSAAMPASGPWPRRGISPCSSQRQRFTPSSGQRRTVPGPRSGDDIDHAAGHRVASSDDQLVAEQRVCLQLLDGQPDLGPDHVVEQVAWLRLCHVVGGPERVHHGLDVPGCAAAALDDFDGFLHRAAPLVAEDEHEPCRREEFRPELDASQDHLVVQGLRAGPDHEHLAEPAVEHDLWRNPRVDAGDHGRERVLVVGQEPAPLR